MNKVRSILATIALAIALLSGLSLQEMGSLANAASNHHVGSVSSTLVGEKTSSVAFSPRGQCPGSPRLDC